MTDPRMALRSILARSLRVRANVRAIAAKLAAGEAALQRAARGSDDPDMATLRSQLACERSAIDTLARELDDRIAALTAQSAELETGFIQGLTVAARSSRPKRRSLP